MRSFFAYDLVGFQTATDLANFQRFLVDFQGASLSDDKLTTMGRTIIAAVFPIDDETFAAMAHTAEAKERILNKAASVSLATDRWI